MRQERAVAEKAKVDRVENELKEYLSSRESASAHANQFAKTATNLHRSCSTLDKEFKAIMERATSLRDSLAKQD